MTDWPFAPRSWPFDTACWHTTPLQSPSTTLHLERRQVAGVLAELHGHQGLPLAISLDSNSQIALTRQVKIMEIATVSGLKTSLSAYLRQVKAGEEVLITERGRPIARLLPIAGPSSLAEHLNEMERKGLLRRPKAPLPADFWDWPRPVDADATVRAAVSREREEGW